MIGPTDIHLWLGYSIYFVTLSSSIEYCSMVNRSLMLKRQGVYDRKPNFELRFVERHDPVKEEIEVSLGRKSCRKQEGLAFGPFGTGITPIHSQTSIVRPSPRHP